MSILTVCLLSVLVPQQKPGGLVLPPKTQERAPADQTQLTELERFHRDAMKLRRSILLKAGDEDVLLQRLRLNYQDPAALALRLAAKADADLVHGLLKAVVQFSLDRPKAAEELLFLLQTKPFASATRAAAEALVELHPEKAKEHLLTCLTARYAGVRKAATDLLLARIDQSDLDVVVKLARGEDEDIRRKALFLLGALPYPPARECLLEAIASPRATIAATACKSLIAHGPDVAPDLEAMLARPSFDRSFGYAAFALTALEDQTGQVFLSEDMAPALLREVRGTDSFLRTTAALALANLAFRSRDARGEQFADRQIVDGLLLVVAPQQYVPNISMLQKPAAKKLVQFTGQDFRGRNSAWRAWWERSSPGFIGMRLRVDVTPESGADAVLTWTTQRRTLQFVGERAVQMDAPKDVVEFILTGAEMAALVQRLESLGFMGKGLMASAAATEMLPVGRTLELRLGSFRSKISGPAESTRWLDVLDAEVAVVAERERWQMYLPPGERLALWRAERTWLAEHSDPGARTVRLKERIIAALPRLSAERREVALGHLLGLPEVRSLLTEAEGIALLDLARSSERLDAAAFHLMEVALLAPGDKVWRRALDLIDDRRELGGREVLSRVFSLLGPDKVLAAMRDSRPSLRIAAMHEVADLADLRAIPVLREAIGDSHERVRETAVYALGVLRVADARDDLLKLQADPDLPASTRRVAWVALGRIGGDEVLPLLKAGAGFPELADQLAAMQAMGELRNADAAQFLALVFASRGYGPLGTQAVASLQKMGGLLAMPALRRHLRGRDPERLRELVLLLAEFQDPTVVDYLIPMLDDVRHGARVSMLLATITGVDLTDVNERVATMQRWWRTHSEMPQAMWFLEALRREKIDSPLTLAQLAPKSGVAAVPELTRILLSARRAHLRVMAGALLRETTNQEFGRVSMQSTVAQLQAIADRYRYFADAEKTDGKR